MGLIFVLYINNRSAIIASGRGCMEGGTEEQGCCPLIPQHSCHAFVVHICFRASYFSTASLRSVFINSIWSQSNENDLKLFDARAAAISSAVIPFPYQAGGGGVSFLYV